MKIIIESARDPQLGPCYLYRGDVDVEGRHSFRGTEFSLDAAFEMAKECIRVEAQHWSIPINVDVPLNEVSICND